VYQSLLGREPSVDGQISARNPLCRRRQQEHGRVGDILGLADTKRVSIDTTDKAFNFIQRFRDRTDTLLRGVQIILGEGENAVQIRFNERELTAAAIETAIRGIRAALGDEQAAVQILIKGGVSFGDGFALKEFAELASIELKSGDVIQDADR
jgi:hypothetical protein